MLHRRGTVTLTAEELSRAHEVAEARHYRNVALGRKDQHGEDKDMSRERHILGAIGEVAVSRWTGIPWRPQMDNFRKKDVGPYEVRGIGQDHHRLLLHDKDLDDDPFLLVLHEHGIWAHLLGWMWAYDGKHARFLDSKREGGLAYFVPQSELHPIDTLPRPKKG